MKIIITEAQLKSIISEQQIPLGPEDGGTGEDKATKEIKSLENRDLTRLESCLPNKEIATVVYAALKQKDKIKKLAGLRDDKTFLNMLKYAIATMGRESDYSLGDIKDTAALTVRNLPLGNWLMDTIEDVAGQGMSLGPAQFTKDAWDAYGLDKKVGDFTSVGNFFNSLVGTLYRIASDYKLGLERGVGTSPSVNPIAVKQGKIKNIEGTGNVSMDLAIIAHNMGQNKIKKYCKTSDSRYNAPCDSKNGLYKPFKDKPAITVYTDKVVPGYFPNLKHNQLTSIGYLEEVVKRAKGLTCII